MAQTDGPTGNTHNASYYDGRIKRWFGEYLIV